MAERFVDGIRFNYTQGFDRTGKRCVSYSGVFDGVYFHLVFPTDRGEPARRISVPEDPRAV